MALKIIGKPVPEQNPLPQSKNLSGSKPAFPSAEPTVPLKLPTKKGTTGGAASPASMATDAVPTVASSFQRLIGTAAKLNEVSDQLTTTVHRLDTELKKLNLGVTTWVDVKYERDPDEVEFLHEKIGYMRIGAKWGIALNSIKGLLGDDPRNYEDHLWLFTDAPRELRLRAVEKIPELIEALDRAARGLAQRVVSRIGEVNELASVIEAQTGGSK
jgi:hypothetical protein